MEFFIKKNATLPTLRMVLVKDGRSDYHNFIQTINNSSVYFSMIDSENGRPKITSKVVTSVKQNPENPNEYYIIFQFGKKDTNKVGRYEGQFIIKNNQGDLVLPTKEKIYINVLDAFVYQNECCAPPKYPSPTSYLTPTPSTTQTSTLPPTPTPSTTQISTLPPTSTPTPSTTETSPLLPTPTPSTTLPFTTTTTTVPSNDLYYIIIPDNDLYHIVIPNDNFNYQIIPNNDLYYEILMEIPIIKDLYYIIIPDNDLTYQIIPDAIIIYRIIPNNDLSYIILFPTPIFGPTPTPTSTPTETPTPTPTKTPTFTPTNTSTETPTPTSTPTPTPTELSCDFTYEYVNGFLQQENLFYILQENGGKLIIT